MIGIKDRKDVWNREEVLEFDRVLVDSESTNIGCEQDFSAYSSCINPYRGDGYPRGIVRCAPCHQDNQAHPVVRIAR